MSIKNYFVISLEDLDDNFVHHIMVTEDNLASFLTNYNKKTYKLIGVDSLGGLIETYNDYLASDEQLEKGKEE